MEKNYNKLVRDNIPDIIRSNGETPVTKILDNTEYKKDEAKNFFESVWEFVEKIFGGGEMPDKTDWPVKRTI